MQSPVPGWFGAIDCEPHCYTVYEQRIGLTLGKWVRLAAMRLAGHREEAVPQDGGAPGAAG